MLAKERLSQLLALAAERRWNPLARELSDLVLYWPQDYPAAMQPLVVVLFETALREADPATQADLAPRLAGRSDIPLRVLNVTYLGAPAPLRREILMRNELEDNDGLQPQAADKALILAAARAGTEDFAAALAAGTGVPRHIAQQILADVSGEPLAVLCRGTGLDRATFSAIAVLKGPPGLALSAYDTVAPRAATRLVYDWRKSLDQPVHPQIEAAE